jgi:hypothetical protein
MTFTALVLTACAMAMGATDTNGAPSLPVAGQTTPAPFVCALLADRSGSGTRLEARITARETLAASYSLEVRGPGISIDQGGDLSLAAGETAFLGEATVSAELAALDARLSVTTEGRTFRCPSQEP